MYEDPARDFALRTKSNLLAIERLDEATAVKPPSEMVYPFTQLCNSLLGLIVLPKEQFFQRLPETPLADMPALRAILSKMTWEVKHRRGPQRDQAKEQTFRELATVLRHAVAHFNLEFIGRGGQVVGVKLWNIPPGAATKDFEMESKPSYGISRSSSSKCCTAKAPNEGSGGLAARSGWAFRRLAGR